MKANMFVRYEKSTMMMENAPDMRSKHFSGCTLANNL